MRHAVAAHGRRGEAKTIGKERAVTSLETPSDTRDMYMVHTMFRREFATGAALPTGRMPLVFGMTYEAGSFHG